MGDAGWGDDGPPVCFNAAKSWSLGWYSADSVTLDLSAGAVIVTLVGVADWVSNVYTRGQHKVVIQIKDSSQIQDIYVIYNRAKGPNGGVIFAKDQVRGSNDFYKLYLVLCKKQ